MRTFWRHFYKRIIFNASALYLGVVSSLIKEEDISVDELRKLLDEVEQGNKN